MDVIELPIPDWMLTAATKEEFVTEMTKLLRRRRGGLTQSKRDWKPDIGRADKVVRDAGKNLPKDASIEVAGHYVHNVRFSQGVSSELDVTIVSDPEPKVQIRLPEVDDPLVSESTKSASLHTSSHQKIVQRSEKLTINDIRKAIAARVAANPDDWAIIRDLIEQLRPKALSVAEASLPKASQAEKVRDLTPRQFFEWFDGNRSQLSYQDLADAIQAWIAFRGGMDYGNLKASNPIVVRAVCDLATFLGPDTEEGVRALKLIVPKPPASKTIFAANLTLDEIATTIEAMPGPLKPSAKELFREPFQGVLNMLAGKSANTFEENKELVDKLNTVKRLLNVVFKYGDLPVNLTCGFPRKPDGTPQYKTGCIRALTANRDQKAKASSSSFPALDLF